MAPHPDDEVFGCGGTIRKYHEKGSRITVVYMTNGCSGCRTIFDEDKVAKRAEEAKAGLKILGCEDYVFFNFQDSELNTNERTIGALLGVLEKFHPDIILVPSILDNHPDHVESAIIIAQALKRYSGRPVCLCYEVWTALLPNYFVDITDTISFKELAMKAHGSQLVNNNLKDSIIGLNSYRSLGMGTDVRYCEAFISCSKREYIALTLGSNRAKKQNNDK